ncbi:MAG: lysophospholipid acyltransferase family protein [Bacteroidota bacterium]
MQAISFYILLPFIYLLSLLPFWVMYRISDGLYYILYYLVGYRRKIVEQNLHNSFPDKTDKEIKELSKKFYSYLCDLTLETFKKITMTRKQTMKHIKFHDTTLFEKIYAEKKSIILLMGHYGNWEWAGSSFTLQTDYQLYVIYKPLSNKHFEDLIVKTRTVFGTKLIKVHNTLRDMISNKGIISATAFIADQTPFPDNAYWTKFLNQDTPVFTGAEKLSKKLDYPIVYIKIDRVKRGYYDIHAELLFENPKATSENEISETFIKRLEKDIIEKPEIWLWSHRRWKHKKPVPVQ